MTHCVDQIHVRYFAFEAKQKPPAANVLEYCVGTLAQFLHTAAQKIAHAFHILNETIGEDTVQYRIAGGCGQRIAAVSGAMGAGYHALGRISGGHAGPNGETTTDALTQGSHVWVDTRPFMG